jgi:hypothetical protein
MTTYRMESGQVCGRTRIATVYDGRFVWYAGCKRDDECRQGEDLRRSWNRRLHLKPKNNKDAANNVREFIMR